MNYPKFDFKPNFEPESNSRESAYEKYIDFEMGFDDPDVRNIISFEEFCKELDKGYGNSDYLEVARLYEDENGMIYYDCDFNF